MAASGRSPKPSPSQQQCSTNCTQTAPSTISPPLRERSSARSASPPTYLETSRYASHLPVHVHPCVASPKPPNLLKRTPTRPARLIDEKQRIVRIINATYAVCRRWRLDPETRSLAYPVYRISESSFLIPAPWSHYRKLCSYIQSTDAANTSIDFRKSALLPGRSTPTSCIVVKMVKAGHEVAKGCGQEIMARVRTAEWKHNGELLPIIDTGSAVRNLVRPDNTSFGQEPDASWAIEGFDYPFVVVEVCDSQTIKELKRKVHRWIHYSNNKVKIVCFFEIEAVPTAARYRMLASVIKAEKHPNPSPEKPNGFKIVPRVAVHRQDISTECNTGAFTISAAEVYPDEWQESVTTGAHVTITLTSLYSRAFASVREKAAQVARDGEEVRPWNPDEEEVWTPSSSGSWEDDYQSPSEPDDLTDGNYES